MQVGLATQRACPHCAETISVAAKVCPRCRQWLTWRSLRNPIVNALAIGYPMLACFGGLLFMVTTSIQQLFQPRPFYSEVPEPLAVLESWVNWMETTNGPRLYVTGILTNRSEFAWRDVEFECRFFDGSHRMVDAAHGRAFMTVQTRDDAAFRLAVTPGRPQADYQSHQVTVSTARNANSAF